MQQLKSPEVRRWLKATVGGRAKALVSQSGTIVRATGDDGRRTH
jgi:hypothetical protein